MRVLCCGDGQSDFTMLSYRFARVVTRNLQSIGERASGFMERRPNGHLTPHKFIMAYVSGIPRSTAC